VVAFLLIATVFNLLNDSTTDELEKKDIDINLSVITNEENLKPKTIMKLNISINLDLNALIFSNNDRKYESDHNFIIIFS